MLEFGGFFAESVIYFQQVHERLLATDAVEAEDGREEADDNTYDTDNHCCLSLFPPASMQ